VKKTGGRADRCESFTRSERTVDNVTVIVRLDMGTDSFLPPAISERSMAPLNHRQPEGAAGATVACDVAHVAILRKRKHKLRPAEIGARRPGGFETMFLISHSPEVIDGADHCINFSDGPVTVS
jgi:hypothetical protein